MFFSCEGILVFVVAFILELRRVQLLVFLSDLEKKLADHCDRVKLRPPSPSPSLEFTAKRSPAHLSLSLPSQPPSSHLESVATR